MEMVVLVLSVLVVVLATTALMLCRSSRKNALDAGEKTIHLEPRSVQQDFRQWSREMDKMDS